MTARCAALLRGINVGGAKEVRTACLPPPAGDTGLREVSAGPGLPGAVATTRHGTAVRKQAEATRG
ncbi:hypothetical protein ABZ705_05250 [Streptomyces sp. NPDC006984]|uniref:hypothetical protein n=1 Tax=Streptomyces sp. NPDC006984 TaxID=3155463 RepID=UPI0033D5E879